MKRKSIILVFALVQMIAISMYGEGVNEQQVKNISEVLFCLNNAKMICVDGWINDDISFPQIIDDTNMIHQISSLFRNANFIIERDLTQEFRRGTTISAAEHLEFVVDTSNRFQVVASDLVVCKNLLTFKTDQREEFVNGLSRLFKNNQKKMPNHGLESTGAPPAAGTPETHP